VPETAWITTVDEQEASGEVAEAYLQAADRATGRVAHILKVHSLNPRSLLAHRSLYRTLKREMIGTVVSAINACHY